MKFSEMPYQRPNLDEIKAQFAAVTQRFAAAPDYAAAKAAFEGHTGEMVALDRISNAPYQCGTSLHPISEVANLEKKVPLEWVNADHTAMTEEFLAYALPLVQAELTPIYVEGLPHHIYLPEA